MKNTTPAVLLYYQDFLTGCAEMTMEERGFYITLLCYQNIHGRMSRDYVDRVCPGCPEYVLEKFDRDEEGLYYNKRMDDEIQRRVSYQQSRSSNGSKGGRPKKEEECKTISFSEKNHIETETETETHKEKVKVSATAESVISHLNLRTGKRYRASSQQAVSKINARLNEGYTLDDFMVVIDVKAMEWMGTEMEKYLRPETLFGPKFESYLNQRPARRELTNREIAMALDEAERRAYDKGTGRADARQSVCCIPEYIQRDE